MSFAKLFRNFPDWSNSRIAGSLRSKTQLLPFASGPTETTCTHCAPAGSAAQFSTGLYGFGRLFGAWAKTQLPSTRVTQTNFTKREFDIGILLSVGEFPDRRSR